MVVKQVKSVVGTPLYMRETVKGLGLRRIGHSVNIEDTPSTRGMVAKVHHLVRIIEGEQV